MGSESSASNYKQVIKGPLWFYPFLVVSSRTGKVLQGIPRKMDLEHTPSGLLNSEDTAMVSGPV